MDRYDLSGKRAALIMCGGGRPGSEYDVKRIKEFCKQNKFPESSYRVECKTKEDVTDALKSFRDNLSGDVSCLAMFIMAHGALGHIEVNDEEVLDLEEIYQMFNNSQCPALREKPKLFVVQACRGVKERPKDPYTDGGRSSGAFSKRLLPTESDSMEVYAVPPGKLAIRHPDRGCPLFEEMHKVFTKDSVVNHDVYELFTEVNRRLGQRKDGRKDGYEHDDFMATLGDIKRNTSPVESSDDIGRSLQIVTNLTKKLYL
ncbi:caspase-14-like [Coregonus clupeaformis]|uniref:caspase-14-like n=1 Tax=Coregonus clupeaformis TaxID=59861 RepID=UPI001E1C2968|nr:caspase-14-like [Coregonus clupeaformis]